MDKSKTVFVNDDNEHHMQLKLGLNNWEDIQVKSIAKVTEVPNVTDVYSATLTLPQDLFAVDFVIQDFRTAKVRKKHFHCLATVWLCSSCVQKCVVSKLPPCALRLACVNASRVEWDLTVRGARIVAMCVKGVVVCNRWTTTRAWTTN
ncbi:MAG: hypothetical protein HC767_10345 [Akkermansiaceae bacterium]|nr:hypothetical protein [Akkermansiaceae bacterium]